MATNNENHDKVYAIVRDAKAGAITVEDAVAKLKGLQDGTQLTEESFTMADNVVSKSESKEEKESRETQEEAVQAELSFGDTVDPGKDADADINNIVGVDETDDTTTLGVVTSTEGDSSDSEAARPEDQLVENGSSDPDKVEAPEATEDAKEAKPASKSNEVAPAVGDTADEEPKKRSKRTKGE